ncbi:hypothetical protein GOP47_0011100 [Adiantum capillus-veneris]|uniref:Uncharacterized protein n=1 Tax=Adiantum capillus-veneris TaxID=13818 RepID=A0A9D4ZGE5_ADICA|nr:hypothetical protein GOP47_0011100 [Adiantum capillus-veneris]
MSHGPLQVTVAIHDAVVKVDAGGEVPRDAGGSERAGGGKDVAVVEAGVSAGVKISTSVTGANEDAR